MKAKLNQKRVAQRFTLLQGCTWCKREGQTKKSPQLLQHAGIVWLGPLAAMLSPKTKHCTAQTKHYRTSRT
jgi:hypothetical protein